MQTLSSSKTDALAPAVPFNDAQLHQGQLDDYERLLSALRDPPNVINLHNLLAIKPSSPMTRISEDGFNALWELLRDKAYIEMCAKHDVNPGSISATLNDGGYAYTAWTNDGTPTTWPVTQLSKWQALMPRIEQAATLLGGQLMSNRFITLGRMSWFYGLTSWRPRHPQEHPAAIHAVEEKIASHQLKLEDDFDILELRRRPTEEDRAAFRAHRRESPDASLADIHQVHAAIIRKEVIKTINTFLPKEGASALTHLAGDILNAATIEQVRATPTVYLRKILQSAEADRLGTVMLSALNWYGGKPDEETSPFIRIKLIAGALQHWLASQGTEKPGDIAGYSWNARTNWGKSYPAIRADFPSAQFQTGRFGKRGHCHCTAVSASIPGRFSRRRNPARAYLSQLRGLGKFP